MNALEKLMESYSEENTLFGRDTDGSIFVIHPLPTEELDAIGWGDIFLYPLGKEVRYLIACAGAAWAGKPRTFDDDFPGPARITKEQAWRMLGWTFYPEVKMEKRRPAAW